LWDVLKKYAPTVERVKVMWQIDALSDALSQHGGGGSPDDQRELSAVLLQKAEVILQSAGKDPAEALILIQ
jgi:hypothetical protein